MNLIILIKISLKLVPVGQINIKSAKTKKV